MPALLLHMLHFTSFCRKYQGALLLARIVAHNQVHVLNYFSNFVTSSFLLEGKKSIFIETCLADSLNLCPSRFLCKLLYMPHYTLSKYGTYISAVQTINISNYIFLQYLSTIFYATKQPSRLHYAVKFKMNRGRNGDFLFFTTITCLEVPDPEASPTIPICPTSMYYLSSSNMPFIAKLLQ